MQTCCPSCGRPDLTGARWCPGCGTQLITAPPTTPFSELAPADGVVHRSIGYVVGMMIMRFAWVMLLFSCFVGVLAVVNLVWFVRGQHTSEPLFEVLLMLPVSASGLIASAYLLLTGAEWLYKHAVRAVLAMLVIGVGVFAASWVPGLVDDLAKTRTMGGAFAGFAVGFALMVWMKRHRDPATVSQNHSSR